MRVNWFVKHFPTPQRLKDNRFLKPFARHLHHHFLWQFNRRTVAGGATIGLFFGILVPFLQIFLAAFAAIFLRVNLPVAAFSTLVSNPLTFPPIYYLAYRLGDFLVGSSPNPPETLIAAEIGPAVSMQQNGIVDWLPNLFGSIQTIGLPLSLGLFVMATVAALACYVTVSTVWKLRVR